MDTTSTAPAAALPATALPVGADAAMWQDIAGASMEADFESDLAHALALSQEEAPVETAATEADAGIRPLRKKLKAADVDAFDVDTECPICFETFFPRAQVTACPQCFSGVTHAGYCTMTLKDAPMLLTRATGDTDDERFFKLCCLSLPPSLSLSLSNDVVVAATQVQTNALLPSAPTASPFVYKFYIVSERGALPRRVE